MSKKEIYYEFMFPNYKDLSQSTSDPNASRQCGQVRDLCNVCPKRVITYDMLSSSNLSDPYTEADWDSTKRQIIKNYIDQYLKIPKYFNLRNYWDADPCQSGGMSLMVSHSPEVGVVPIWTKFKASDNKIIYCSLIVSSGDFFYGWNLPDDVLAKSGLRDEIVYNKFHSNWYIRDSDITEYRAYSAAIGHPTNPLAGSEKGIFDRAYFLQGKLVKRGKRWKDDAETELIDLTNSNHIAWQSLFYNKDWYTPIEVVRNENDPVGLSYMYRPTSYRVSFSKKDGTVVDAKKVYCLTTTDEIIGDGINEKYRYFPNEQFVKKYYIIEDNQKIDVYKTEYSLNSKDYPSGTALANVPLKYSHIQEDLKKDYIDLEVTRRILHYSPTPGYLDYNGKPVPIVSSITDIPKAVSGFGKNIILSFEPPQEYINNPPLQIPYDKLRYALNDRPPFSDCETVLVMWVANSDPSNVADGNVSGLHSLDWQQYAIPISVRCCFKDATNNSNKYVHDRFLVSYPYVTKDIKLDDTTQLPTDNSKFRFHYRHNEAYDKNVFRESLFLQDLIEYSKDYIVSYQNTEYYNIGFDVQRFLFNNLTFKKLYTRNSFKDVWTYINGVRTKTLGWNTNTQQQQVNYVSIDARHFKINTTSSAFKTCLESVASPGTEFRPSTVINRSDYEKWDYPAENYFYINDNCIIAMFDANDSKVKKETGTLKLKDDSGIDGDFTLSSLLGNDIYLSSLGLLNHKWIDNDSIMYGTSLGAYPLNILDNHLMINGTLYGSKTNQIIVGLKQAYDYTNSDCLHFTKNGDDYILQEIDKSTNYTVYYMDYTP